MIAYMVLSIMLFLLRFIIISCVSIQVDSAMILLIKTVKLEPIILIYIKQYNN